MRHPRKGGSTKLGSKWRSGGVDFGPTRQGAAGHPRLPHRSAKGVARAPRDRALPDRRSGEPTRRKVPPRASWIGGRVRARGRPSGTEFEKNLADVEAGVILPPEGHEGRERLHLRAVEEPVPVEEMRDQSLGGRGRAVVDMER